MKAAAVPRKMAILFQESSVISLRTVFVQDNGNLVSFSLTPADLTALMTRGRTWSAPKDFEWVMQDTAWLYRRMRSLADEMKLMSDFHCVEQDVRPITFARPPEFKVRWADSGNSVALYLNGEPWAFVNEETREGYSKGILRPAGGRLWEQELFERIFKVA